MWHTNAFKNPIGNLHFITLCSFNHLWEYHESNHSLSLSYVISSWQALIPDYGNEMSTNAGKIKFMPLVKAIQ